MVRFLLMLRRNDEQYKKALQVNLKGFFIHFSPKSQIIFKKVFFENLEIKKIALL